MSRIITIDGPAGAGKTTVSKALASRLGWVYVDTGALYRAVAHEISRQNLNWQDEQILEEFLKDLDISFSRQTGQNGDELSVISSGKDITSLIRTPEISMLASTTSAIPAVRTALLGIQKDIGSKQDAVFEGRDMGTVVFPDAQVKFFLSADLQIRAQRRHNQLQDPAKDIETIKREIQKRDEQDAARSHSPLKPAPDAIRIDASDLNVEQVVDIMMAHIPEHDC